MQKADIKHIFRSTMKTVAGVTLASFVLEVGFHYFKSHLFFESVKFWFNYITQTHRVIMFTVIVLGINLIAFYSQKNRKNTD